MARIEMVNVSGIDVRNNSGNWIDRPTNITFTRPLLKVLPKVPRI